MPGSAGSSEHESEPPSRASPAQVGLGDNGPSHVESELASLASRVVIGQIEYSDLSPDDLRQPLIIEACLKNSHAATELLTKLHLYGPRELIAATSFGDKLANANPFAPC